MRTNGHPELPRSAASNQAWFVLMAVLFSASIVGVLTDNPYALLATASGLLAVLFGIAVLSERK